MKRKGRPGGRCRPIMRDRKMRPQELSRMNICVNDTVTAP